jgi:2-polyprenyl-3-methyl-5-hydroxy-6-metoxy-1,4-benzoquinol methylase
VAGAAPTGEPSEWLAAHAAQLPRSGVALDVACGRGRNAFWLAGRGLSVRAVDRDEAAVAHVRAVASAGGLTIDAEVQDLEVIEPGLGQARYDVIVAVHYLHRPLFPHLIAALRPGGLLVYETFTQAQARRGKPTNPAFLLAPGELRSLTAGLTILAGREGEFGGRDVASIVCRKT